MKNKKLKKKHNKKEKNLCNFRRLIDERVLVVHGFNYILFFFYFFSFVLFHPLYRSRCHFITCGSPSSGKAFLIVVQCPLQQGTHLEQKRTCESGRKWFSGKIHRCHR